MTPESRAKELMAEIVQRGTGGWRFADEVEECLPLIASAIRSAENDKLEEAARLMDRVMADSKAALIRTLKHED